LEGGSIEMDRKKKRIGIILILVLGVWLGKTFTSQAMMRRDLAEERKLEEKKIASLERDIRNLEKEIESKDSLGFVEKVAREDFKMVKPREIIYIDKNRNKNKKDFINPINK